MGESLSENLFVPIEIPVLDGFGDKGAEIPAGIGIHGGNEHKAGRIRQCDIWDSHAIRHNR